MKKLNFFSSLLIALLFISCSSDDSPTNDPDPEQILKLYKKTESVENGSISVIQEVFYNSNSKIQSISYVEENFVNRIYSITYSGNVPTEIMIESDYVNPNTTDETIIYNNITTGTNSTILISDNSDKTLEIYHSNGFVNSTRWYPTSTQTNIFEQTFTRNSSNQLTSNTSGNLILTYSNFDENKKIDPSGSVMEFEHSAFFLILNLKVTENNPLTSTVQGQTYNQYLEYDSDGYVTKSSAQPNSTTDFSTHQYIEL